MAEAFQPDQLATDKAGRYRDLAVEIAAVLDVDAETPGAFDAVDALGLETIVAQTFAR